MRLGVLARSGLRPAADRGGPTHHPMGAWWRLGVGLDPENPHALAHSGIDYVHTRLAELADAPDSKSGTSEGAGVRFPRRAPNKSVTDDLAGLKIRRVGVRVPLGRRRLRREI